MANKAEKQAKKAAKQQQKWLKKRLRKQLEQRLDLLLATEPELQKPVDKPCRKQLLQLVEGKLFIQPKSADKFKHPTLFAPFKRNPCSNCPAFHNGLCRCAVKAYRSNGVKF